MNITCIAFGFIFLIIGILFFFGFIHKVTKIWKSMSDEDKSKINIKPLCRNIGGVIALSGVIFLLAGFINIFRENYFTITMIVWLVFAGLDVYYIAKSKKYHNYKNFGKGENNEKERK